MAFDARAAKLLQPGEHLIIDDCPGLRLLLRVPLIGRALEIVQRRAAVHEGWIFPAPTKIGHTAQSVIGSSVARRMRYDTVQPHRKLKRTTR